MNKNAKALSRLAVLPCCLQLAALFFFLFIHKTHFLNDSALNPHEYVGWATQRQPHLLGLVTPAPDPTAAISNVGFESPACGFQVAFSYSGLTKIRTRRRAADSTDSTARRANAVLVFVNSLYALQAAWTLESDISHKGYLKTELHRLPTHFTRKKAETAPYGFSLLLFR